MHLPFCVSKCRYCDFHSIVLKDHDLEKYVELVLAEARVRAQDLHPATVFFGGGTPSILPPDLLARLLDGLNEITGFRASSRETTMEANPESLDQATADCARAGGVNRLSIGVQSLRPDILQAYDRVHSPGDALRAFRYARQAGFERINLDLIHSFPGHDLQPWLEDLAVLVDLQPDHLSCYELSFEPGTPLTRRRDAGRFPEEGEDKRKEVFLATGNFLQEAGFDRYEVSNFARPGEACRHNVGYWLLRPCVGLGSGAVSWDGQARRRNEEDLKLWQRRLGQDAAEEEERPPARTRLFDCYMMGLRMPQVGVTWALAELRSGLDARREYAEAWTTLTDQGLVTLNQERARVTPQGLLLLDSVLEQLLPSLSV